MDGKGGTWNFASDTGTRASGIKANKQTDLDIDWDDVKMEYGLKKVKM